MITPVIGYNRGINRFNENNNSPLFKGMSHKPDMNRIIDWVSNSNSRTIVADSMDVFVEEIKELKGRSLTGNLGILIVGEEDLPRFLKHNFNKYDTKGKVALCIVSGNRSGTVENMTHIFEAETILIDADKIKHNK